MEKVSRFNARCYGLLVSSQGRVMGLKERWRGVDLQKFPGGGLEFGEGMVECLDREVREEFSLFKPQQWHHLYSPTHFFTSQFKPNEQLIITYFEGLETAQEEDWALQPNDPNVLEICWLPLHESSADWFTLESDRQAFRALLERRG